MATATLTRYDTFIDEISKAGHNLQTATYKLALTNTAPSMAHLVWNTTNAPDPTNAGGYTSGGISLTVTSATATSGVFKLVLADANPAWTASGAGIGPFQYAILYNSTGGTNKLIGYYNYGSSITLGATETFTFDADPTNGVLQITMTP